ncbi:ComEA family DNA-binding protein [Ectothiorhodospira lacustris]|uniref:ComEA family DNA-binding protein n=1 Tax=Ectothiorhodospira lacustris TaxID=2899127 RepID=UPI001EE7D591|nr:helix-hairpin-helix domain-containing protein [Ectothiorhodospira lacustris]MCG5501990.1 helix-hairpin-helix domain-containing protein [Ectothiorhodospira lacustris]MCG5509317.1 helix-hairpin-helix domain-containing protein [Ectothiorhodospira lacustris]MCG5521371.1 helix-hairpin-helix domain-containing protein [Ectothiorhodospira lacustris]
MKRLTSLIVLFSLLFTATGAWSAGPVNVNEADAQSLSRTLTGVGLTRAEAIVAHREQHGPFTSVHQLMQVPGIGPRTVEQNLDRIELGSHAQQD